MISHQSCPKGDEVAVRRPPLASMEEVAGYLSKPVQTLRAWRHRGIGPRSFKVGTTVRYRWSDVDAWLEQQATNSNEHGTEAPASQEAS